MGSLRMFREANGAPIALTVNGERVEAFEGETVGAALLAAGRTGLRASRLGSPRGMYCGIGLCYECLVLVDGVSVRACMTPVRAGAVIEVVHE
jgi:aerobic-type carbon monoxide dehydrogenase small subunit (CoxS/CutS family)